MQKTVIVLAALLIFAYIVTHIEFHRTHNQTGEHEPRRPPQPPHHPRKIDPIDQVDKPPAPPPPAVVVDDGDKKAKDEVAPKRVCFLFQFEARLFFISNFSLLRLFYLINKKPAFVTKLRRKPKIRTSFPGAQNERQKMVVKAFLHAWKGYKEYAWGEDECRPISKRSSSWFNLGLTIVDSLDTIYIMNLNEQFDEARLWVDTKLSFDVDAFNNLFEITIRIMGGLLSAYHLSGDKMFLAKAYELGNRSLPAFDTPSHIPYSDINLKQRRAKSPHWTTDSSLAEVTSLQVEYKDLTYATGDPRFKHVASLVSEKIHALHKPNGLAQIYINTESGQFSGGVVTLGARGDSYYEYLLKQWIQNGASFDAANDHHYLLVDWLDAVKGIRERLVGHTRPNNLTFVGELISNSFSPKMDHLVCFLPGNLALGAMYLQRNRSFPRSEIDELMQLAEELTETCYKMYELMATGLSPEIVQLNSFASSTVDMYVRDADRHNLLRPETVESLYYLYKITKKKKYQEYGWRIFESFEKYARVDSGGYTSMNDVTNVNNVRPKDKMESFFLAETLKYFYLLFEDDADENFNLNKWIFNTEAHPLPIYSSF